MDERHPFLRGAKINPPPISSTTTVVELIDTAFLVALPLLTAYALASHKPRKPKRLYERRQEFYEILVAEYRTAHPGGLK